MTPRDRSCAWLGQARLTCGSGRRRIRPDRQWRNRRAGAEPGHDGFSKTGSGSRAKEPTSLHRTRGRVAASVRRPMKPVCLVSALHAAPGDSTNTDTDEETGLIVPSASQVGWTGGTRRVRTTRTLYRDRCNGDDPSLRRTNSRRFAAPSVSTSRFRPRTVAVVRRPPSTQADRTMQERRPGPSPSVNISPDPAAGAYVNFGLWLAVDDPGPGARHGCGRPRSPPTTSSTWNMGSRPTVS